MNIEEVLQQLAGGEEVEKVANNQSETETETETHGEISPEILKIAQALSESPEALAALDGIVESAEEAEKTAEAEKLAAELETQGRVFGRGQIMEQTKIAYLMEEVDDDYVIKLAEVLEVDPYDLLGIDKEAAVDVTTGGDAGSANQINAHAVAKQDAGAGQDADAPAQSAIIRPMRRAEELAGLSSIAKALKAARNNPTDLADNG